MIYEQLEMRFSAAWASVRAAWICDDAEIEEKATYCRLRAVELFKKARAQLEPMIIDNEMAEMQIGHFESIMAELLRRVGKFK